MMTIMKANTHVYEEKSKKHIASPGELFEVEDRAKADYLHHSGQAFPAKAQEAEDFLAVKAAPPKKAAPTK